MVSLTVSRADPAPEECCGEELLSFSPQHNFSNYLNTGAGSIGAAATGGGALPLPLPIVPQALRPATESNVIVNTTILLIKLSFPQ